MSRQAGIAVGIVALLLLLVGLLLERGAQRGAAPDEPAVSRAGEAERGASESAPNTVAPEASPSSQEAPPSRTAATAAGERMRTAQVRGRLVMKEGGPPPGEANVTILTGKREFDAPETAPASATSGGRQGLLAYLGVEESGRAPSRIKYAHRTTAAPDGAFAIAVPPDLPEFRFVVHADYAVYADGEARYTLESECVRGGVVLVLEPAGRVEGRLTAAGGKPAPEGEVRLYREPYGFWFRPIGLGDGDGRFVIRGVLPGRYGASAKAEGCASAVARDLEVRAVETTRVDFELPAESFVAGVVVDSSGRGVQGARVQATRHEGGSVAGSLEGYFKGLDNGEGETDSSGAFRIGGLRGPTYWVGITRRGMLPVEGERVVEVPNAGGVADLRFGLEEGKALSGRVVDDLGKPIANASVVAGPDFSVEPGARRRGIPRVGQGADTSEDGTFRMTGVPDCALKVSARAPGHGSVEVAPVEPSSTDLEIVLPRVASISGVVRAADTGEPVTRFDVLAVSFRDGPIGRRSSSSHGQSMTAPEGKFTLGNLEPLRHELTFRARGFLWEKVGPVELRSGESRSGLEVSLRRGGAVRGIVVEKGTGIPVAGAIVTKVEAEASPMVRFHLEKEAKHTGSDGAFEVDGLEPGTVRLRATQGSFAPKEFSTEVSRGEAAEGVVVELSRGGRIEGIYLDEGGSPMREGRIGLAEEGGRESNERGVDANGSFRFEGLAPGRFQVRGRPPRAARTADERGEASAIVAVDEGGVARVELRPEPRGGCTIRGRALRGVEPVERAHVYVLPRIEAADHARIALARDRSNAWTDVEGSYSVEGVRPGEADLVVETNWGFCTNAFPIVVPDAPGYPFDARLPGGSIEGKVRRATDGTPVTACVVSATPFPWKTGRGRSWVRGTNVVGFDAAFALKDLASGAYFVTVLPSADPHFGTAPPRDLAGQTLGPIEVAGDAHVSVDFSLREGGAAVVAVVDDSGAPVSGAAVFAIPAEARDQPHRLFLGRRATTDSSGAARIERLSAGLYVAAVVGEEGKETTSETKGIGVGEETRFTVEMKR